MIHCWRFKGSLHTLVLQKISVQTITSSCRQGLGADVESTRCHLLDASFVRISSCTCPSRNWFGMDSNEVPPILSAPLVAAGESCESAGQQRSGDIANPSSPRSAVRGDADQSETHHTPIYFNVGGRIFVTSAATLSNGGPENMLTRLAESTLSAASVRLGTSDNPLFLDRDAELFASILAYLRNVAFPEAVIPTAPQTQARLLVEARYFRLSSLCSVLEEELGRAGNGVQGARRVDVEEGSVGRTRFVVVVCERVVTLVGGNPVDGYVAIGGKIDLQKGGFFRSFSYEQLTKSFEEKMATRLEELVSRGYAIVSTNASSALANVELPGDERAGGKSKLTCVHSVTYVLRAR